MDWQIYKLFDNRDVDPDFLSFVREQDDFTLLVMVPEGVAPEGDGHVALFLWPQFFECHVHFQMVGDLHLGDADGLFPRVEQAHHSVRVSPQPHRSRVVTQLAGLIRIFAKHVGEGAGDGSRHAQRMVGRRGVRVYGDVFEEFPFPPLRVECHDNASGVSGGYRAAGPPDGGTSAIRLHVADEQGRLAPVREDELAADFPSLFRDSAEVVRCFFPIDSRPLPEKQRRRQQQ